MFIPNSFLLSGSMGIGHYITHQIFDMEADNNHLANQSNSGYNRIITVPYIVCSREASGSIDVTFRFFDVFGHFAHFPIIYTAMCV